MDATFVDAEGSESNVWNLEVVDGHLQTQADAEDKRKVDITFQDDFTCYDAVTDTFYLRGDRSEAAYQELVAGKMYVYDLDDPEYMRLTFQEDGTAEQSQKGDAIEGTWKVCTPNVVVCHYAVDGSEWDSEYRFVYDEENNIAELYSGSPNTLKLFVE